MQGAAVGRARCARRGSDECWCSPTARHFPHRRHGQLTHGCGHVAANESTGRREGRDMYSNEADYGQHGTTLPVASVQ